jgi:hypothetical protein
MVAPGFFSIELLQPVYNLRAYTFNFYQFARSGKLLLMVFEAIEGFIINIIVVAAYDSINGL